VVKLADSESFQLKELWRNAAHFVTLAGDHHMGYQAHAGERERRGHQRPFWQGVT
jgi:hypothetical protein